MEESVLFLFVVVLVLGFMINNLSGDFKDVKSAPEGLMLSVALVMLVAGEFVSIIKLIIALIKKLSSFY